MDEMAVDQSQIEAPVETPEVTPETTAPVETITTPEQPVDTGTPTQTIKIKYNGEEMDIPLDEATTLVQKGRNYEKAVERAQREAVQQARDAMIAEQGYEWKGVPITTEAQYKQALKEQEIEQKLSQQNLPQEVIEEILEGRKTRERLSEIETENQRQQRMMSEAQEFRAAYPDVDFAAIPADVYELVNNKGLALIDAYNRLEIPRRLERMQQAIGVKEQNDKNANTSPGGVTGMGDVPNGSYFTKEQVESMSQKEITQNLDAILESQRKWPV